MPPKSGEFSRYEWLASGLLDGTSTHWEQARDVAFDSQGNIVIVGGTSSANFPTTEGAYDRSYGGPGDSGLGTAGETDVFVAKVSRQGKLLWSTFLGGHNYDRAYAVEVGPNDDVFVAGRAGDGFPTTPGVLQPKFAGDDDPNNLYGKQDGFAARLSSDGSRLIWSSYFGSTGQGIVRDMDIDAEGNVYVALTGENTALPYAPQQAGPRSAPRGRHWNGYYGKISSDGRQLLFGTFYGGSNGNVDSVNPSIRVTPSGDAYLVTFTDATDVDCITPNAYQKKNAGGSDLLLMHYTAQNRLAFCTYVGGSKDEVMETHVLAVDAAQRVLIGGGSLSSDFPTTPGSLQPHAGGGYDGILAFISPDGSQLLAGTYLGGPGSDGIEGIEIAPDGDIIFGGSTESALPLTPGALRQILASREALIGRIAPDLSTLKYLSYFGGSGREEFRGLDVRPNGEVAYVGQTESKDFMCKNAFDCKLDPDPFELNQAITYLMLAPISNP